jgi:hypothetical protein
MWLSGNHCTTRFPLPRPHFLNVCHICEVAATRFQRNIRYRKHGNTFENSGHSLYFEFGQTERSHCTKMAISEKMQVGV